MKCFCNEVYGTSKQFIAHLRLEHGQQKVWYHCNVHPKVKSENRRTVERHVRRKHEGMGESIWDHICVSVHEGLQVRVRENDADKNVALQDDQDIQQVEEQVVTSDNNCSGNESFSSIQEEPPGRRRVTAVELNRRVMGMLLRLEAQHNLNCVGQNVLVEQLQDIVTDILQADEVETPQFGEIGSDYKRTKFLQEYMVLVKPVRVPLGTRELPARDRIVESRHGCSGVVEQGGNGEQGSQRVSRGQMKTITRYGYKMPLKETLRLLLKNKDFHDAVTTSENKDGMIFQDNEWMWTGEWGGGAEGDVKTIYLSVSVDDVDICSQHKDARGKHKQCVCVFEVLNVPAKFRSLDKTKHLLFICNSNDRKEFVITDEKMFADLIDTVKASAGGISLTDNENELFRIEVVQFPADSVAATSILRMNAAGKFTKMPCRLCFVKQSELTEVLAMNKFVRRTTSAHEKLCDLVERCTTSKVKAKAVQLTGVKGRNALMELPNFDLRQFPFDPMHVILESGVLHRVMCYFLSYVVRNTSLTEEALNAALQCRVYADGDGGVTPGRIRVDKRDPRKCNLKMKAMTLMMVAHELPFIVRDYLEPDDPYLLHFVLCTRIAAAVTHGQVFTETSIEALRHAVLKHEMDAIQLYGKQILTTKWHMLRHIVEAIMELGPPKNVSCMPHERHYHTLVRKPMQQFRNVSYTLATRHQKWQACTLFDWSHTVPESVSFRKIKCVTYRNARQQVCPEWAASLCGGIMTDFVPLKEYHDSGVKVKLGSYLDLTHGVGYDQLFGEVLCILQRGDEIIFCMRHCQGNEYHADVGAFTVTRGSRIRRSLTDLKSILVVPTLKYNSTIYVIPKFSVIQFS